MSDFLYDLWLAVPPLSNSGFVAAFVVAALVGGLCFARLKANTWNVLFKSLAVAICCLVSLLIIAILGVLVLSTGVFGMARGWASFGDGYIWGLFIAPLLAFFISLSGFAIVRLLR